MYEAGQIFAYEIKGNSAIIWRCFSRDTKAEIPGQLEGYPVTEVAPYAFSAHMGKYEIERGLASGRLRLYVPELYRKEEGGSPALSQSYGQGKDGFPALCGDVLEEIVFPAALRRVGRYCFYNCGHLHKITFYGALSDWGSGVFTGCHQVRQLRVYTDADGKSYLKDVLDELPEVLQVEYYVPDREAAEEVPDQVKTQPAFAVKENDEGSGMWQNFTEGEAGRCGKLIFPEFYEEGVENTPARILETRVHGSGIRYRNCFNSRKFDFHQYDVLFPHAKAQESPEVVGQLVMNRLRYPLELTDGARARYEEYAGEHAKELADLLLAERNLQGIRWLLDLVERRVCTLQASESGSTSLLDYLTERASGLHLAEIMSFLMDYRRVHSPAPKKRKRLEL